VPWALVFVLGVTLAVACFVAWRFRDQALLEDHGFRQTQTALTAFWLGKNGFQLAYETPVAGAPWPTPFEFPVYQWLACKLHQLTDTPLDAAGRLVSFAFLLGCLWPAQMLCRQLTLPRGCGALFGAFLLSSPLYLFFGRSFLIETAAVFFAFASMPFAVRLIQQPGRVSDAVFGGTLMTLGLLQKVTTALPVLAVLAVCWLIVHWRTVLRPRAHLRTLAMAAICFGVPFAISAAWTHFAGDLRSVNALGREAEPGSLSAWIFGEMRMHYSPTVMIEIFWNRMLCGNAAGWLGLVVLATFLGFGRDCRLLRYTAVCVVLATLPVLVFTHVHYLHDYYQTCCLLFLFAALAIAAASLSGMTQAPVAAMTAFAIVVSGLNLRIFARKYGEVVQRTFTASNHGTLALAALLKSEVAPTSAFVAFGLDWSSELSYYSQRKSFTVPWFYRSYGKVWERPAEYLGGMPLGAIVVCPSPDAPVVFDLEAKLRELPDFTRRTLGGCDVLVRASGR
jgi:hypothetical protein